ncbi:MAG: indolepyruvate ferredoxin oxidoreductase family protein [Albidovulum sp.]|nr:indolepyruvate ferredoxin oxidoreductase family protein [Albidovulum sp.]
MNSRDVSLDDRFDLSKSSVLLSGTQALVRLMLMQKMRDAAAGLNTAGYVTGYRGSPLGAVDFQMEIARARLEAADIRFQPGLNEDLAATALWGTQQAELRGEGKYDGVFGLWYGKGPGVDRSGDALRHANMAGTSPRGGVVMALGDDHTGESSTTLHQSEWTLVDSYIPILSPSGVQEILDYGVIGFALSRYSGNWVGLKCMKDTIEATAVVDGNPDRIQLVESKLSGPPGGLNIRIMDTPREREERASEHKRIAAEEFCRANGIDRRVFGKSGAKIGFVAAGKNWLDLLHALELLGIAGSEAERLGLTGYKVGMVWPFETKKFLEWAEGLELIVVVEEKRKLIELQVKEAIFNNRQGRRVYGWKDDRGRELFPAKFALDPAQIALVVGEVLIAEGRGTEAINANIRALGEVSAKGNVEGIAERLPYFCSGCPHNTSTKLPGGARAYAGIGCHYMVQWMDRETVGFTHMGGEGANWIGEAPFSTRNHVFQNIGDGTYNHSGMLAIRASIMAGVNITYKILFNDAVAMTGGQKNDGNLDPARIAQEIRAMGVKEIAVVYDAEESPDRSRFPQGTEFAERSRLDLVQQRISQAEGVSAILYVQTCAAEKRRRRKRGNFPDPDRRVFINEEICEGCGDCGVQSNCVSIVPFETPFGRKRSIDQSSCNKDFSCLNGFCPSFATLHGAIVRKEPRAEFELPEFPEPSLPSIERTYNVVASGIGGTGVVTIGAILAMAAHLDGKFAGMMEMAGLAQKGGAVNVHLRLARNAEDITAVRISVGEADLLVGGDLVVAGSGDTLRLMKSSRSSAVINSYETITGEFTRNADFRLPVERLKLAIAARTGDKSLYLMDATGISKAALGDTIFSNMLVLGAAWQKGWLPLSRDSIRRAIELNGAAAEMNSKAFELGRWAAVDPGLANRMKSKRAAVQPTADAVEIRAGHLDEYAGAAYRRRFLDLVDRAKDPELREAIAKGYHKLLAVKDEFEVARLLLKTEEKARREFSGDFSIKYFLAPPIIAKTGPDGRPAKREFASWTIHLFRLLASMRWLRNSWADPFRHSQERLHERELIARFENDMREILDSEDLVEKSVAIELAELPLSIRGFGIVKEQNRVAADQRRKVLLTKLWPPVRAEPKSEAEKNRRSRKVLSPRLS